MLEYFFRRLFVSAITLFIISLIVFTGLRLIPGDPARVLAGEDADDAGLEEIRERYGLNDPIPVQYLRWAGLVLRGDLGESIRTRISVSKTVLIKLPITLQLSFYSILIALVIDIPSGIFSALRKNSIWDYLLNGLSLSGLSIPNFWLGIMLILLFSVRLDILPASGFIPLFDDPIGNLTRMIMPAFVLAIGLMTILQPSLGTATIAIGLGAMPTFIRLTRGLVLSTREEDYVLGARAIGSSDLRIMGLYILPNIFSPILVQATVSIPGAIIAEAILSFLGLGVQPPHPSWGTMLNAAQQFLESAPWMSWWPGIAIFLLALAFNLAGDGLRDVLDPKDY